MYKIEQFIMNYSLNIKSLTINLNQTFDVKVLKIVFLNFYWYTLM
jgi:hypothetical protein